MTQDPMMAAWVKEQFRLWKYGILLCDWCGREPATEVFFCRNRSHVPHVHCSSVNCLGWIYVPIHDFDQR